MEKSEKNAKNVIGIRCAGEEGFDWMGLAVNRQRLPFTYRGEEFSGKIDLQLT